MNVLILGAGASAAAGYPVTNQLMAELRTEAQKGDEMIRESWKDWEAFRTGRPEPLSTLLNCPNPEVVLSIPDLFEAADDAIQSDSCARARAAMGTPDQEAELRRHEELYKSGTLRPLFQAKRARNLFLMCLYRYFAYKHYNDGHSRKAREYLRRVFRSSLNAGDVVITFNWDTTAERSLGELEMWNPMTGYGFVKKLGVRAPGGLKDYPWPEGKVSSGSPVEVLKLHGSFGWHRSSGGVYFDHPYFLDHLAFRYKDEDFQFRDPDHRRIGPPHDELMIYPSFLKKLNEPELRSIWTRASTALLTATKVEVWGYSLPESDGAARVLLNTLSIRRAAGELDVRVHDPGGEARERWKDFCPAAEIDAARLE